MKLLNPRGKEELKIQGKKTVSDGKQKMKS